MTVDIIEKKALQVVNSITSAIQRVLFAIVNYIRHVTTTCPFFQTPSTLVLSYNSLFHIIPIIHTVPLARARALIRGRLPDSAARIN